MRSPNLLNRPLSRLIRGMLWEALKASGSHEMELKEASKRQSFKNALDRASEEAYKAAKRKALPMLRAELERIRDEAE